MTGNKPAVPGRPLAPEPLGSPAEHLPGNQVSGAKLQPFRTQTGRAAALQSCQGSRGGLGTGAARELGLRGEQAGSWQTGKHSRDHQGTCRQGPPGVPAWGGAAGGWPGAGKGLSEEVMWRWGSLGGGWAQGTEGAGLRGVAGLRESWVPPSKCGHMGHPPSPHQPITTSLPKACPNPCTVISRPSSPSWGATSVLTDTHRAQ